MSKKDIYQFPYVLSRNSYFDNSYEDNDFYKKYCKLKIEISKLDNHLYLLDGLMYKDIGKLDSINAKKAINFKRKLMKKNFDTINDNIIKYFSNKTLKELEKCVSLSHKIELMHRNVIIAFDQFKFKSINNIISKKNNVNYLNGIFSSLNEMAIKNINKLFNNEKLSNKEYLNSSKTLQNYFNRMIFKPTPFSTFEETNIFKLNKNICFNENDKVDFYPTDYINEKFIDFIQNLILKDYTFIDEFYVQINPTIKKNKNIYKYINILKKDGITDYYDENLMVIKSSDTIDLLINLLKKRNNVKVTKLFNLKNDDKKKNVNLIKKLNRLGLIDLNLNISQLDYKSLNKLNNILLSNPSYKNISHLLNIIIHELKFLNNENDAVKRFKIKKRIKELVIKTIKLYSDNNFEHFFKYKDIIYENNTNPNIEKMDYLSNSSKEAFSKIEKIYRLFDNSYLSKIKYRNLFLDNFDENSVVPLLDFFKLVVNSKYRYSDDFFFKNDKDIKQIGKIRNEFLNMMKKNHAKNEINISPDYIDDLYKSFPNILKNRHHYGIYFQKDSKNIIINDIAPGLGRHFSRYLSDLKNDDSKMFIKDTKTFLNSIDDGIIYADIGSTLFLNINKHKQILDYIIDYPKSFINNKGGIYTGNLFVKYDKKFQELIIINENNNIVEPTPMGFQFHRTAPQFYDFLTSFSNSQGSKLSLWDRYYSKYSNIKKESEKFPRIVYNENYVLERSTFKVRIDSLKKIVTSSSLDYKKYIDLEHLLKKINIVNPFFAKTMEDLDGIIDKNKIDIKKWELNISNSKYRKPQYYNIKNFLDYSNFCSLIRSIDTTLTISESLPKENKPVVEYLINLSE